MAKSAPLLLHPSVEYDKVGVGMLRYAVGQRAEIAQQSTTLQGLRTIETNTNVSDKTPHEGLTDRGSPGHHDGHDQDEFPPIETLWAQVLENKQSRPPSGSPTVMNSPTRYEEYLQQQVQPDAPDLIQTIYEEPSSRVGVGRHLRGGRGRSNRHRQALRRSERIKARRKKSTKDPKSC
ncbi:hypothetical protein F5Y03DRAFT_389156 [Xylaria venustula]|nr:hypothetical protein F5Y03DRAFT_389156 [Xylaria venustula]